jgi:hypothetical protein
MYAEDRKTIHDRREMLRVKLKSLAEEARIIRREEHRTYGPLRDELRLHRAGPLRWEARHTHIAYGLIRGRRYEQIEPNAQKPFDKEKVAAMMRRYGSTEVKAAMVNMPLLKAA